MSLEEHNRRRQILDAAFHVFARRGYHKATIKEISHEAELKSPALIYWYFTNKEELFQEVLRARSPLLSLAGGGVDEAQLLERPPEEVLRLLARGYFRSFEHPDTARLFRLLISEAARSPDVGDTFALLGVLQVLQFVVRYLERQIELGRLRPHDTQGGARSFMGMLLAYIMSRELLRPLRAGLPEVEDYTDQVVTTFLHGLAA